MPDQKVGIVGVGLMGSGIALNIQKAGWPLYFLEHPGNQPTEALVEKGAVSINSPAELADQCDTLIVCVTGAPQVKEVLLGTSGILSRLKTGTTVIDCSTSIPSTTLELASQVKTAGGHFLDAPMTRTPKEAAEGRLNLIVGGDRSTFEAQLPLLQSFAENITHAGPVGSGHSLKLIHNFVSLGFSAVLAEAIAASRSSGIDRETVLEVLEKGGGQGVILSRLAPYILDDDPDSFRFSLANANKDLGYYRTMADELGSSVDLASSISEAFNALVEEGHADRFMPELISLMGEPSGA